MASYECPITSSCSRTLQEPLNTLSIWRPSTNEMQSLHCAQGHFSIFQGRAAMQRCFFYHPHQALVSVARFELSSCIYVTGLDFNDQELDNQGKGISFVVCGCSSGLLSKLLLMHILFDQ